MGVSFILPAGGEPLLRRDVLEAAGEMRSILFPIFTNGTLINEGCLALFDKHRIADVITADLPRISNFVTVTIRNAGIFPAPRRHF